MIKANYCISIDNKKDYHISLPWRIPNLPNGLLVDMYVPSVEVPISELTEVLEAFKAWNQAKVNSILSNRL